MIDEIAFQAAFSAFIRNTKYSEGELSALRAAIEAYLSAARSPVEGEWQTMDSAPLGKYETVALPKGEKRVFRKEPVHTWRKDGHTTISYYLPDEGRWNGYTKDAPPDMWHVFPTPPTDKPREAV